MTHIGQDGTMLRRVVGTACCTDPPRWEGLATRALRAVLKFAWRRFNLRAIDAREIPDRASPDPPARTLAPALGAKNGENHE